MFEKDEEVRYTVDNKVGVITGRTHKNPDGTIQYQVKFNNAESIFIIETKLESVKSSEDSLELFQKGIFSDIGDYRRTLYKHRLSGELTNIMYSMNNSATKFLAHQFIPVTKFLESFSERLLIADEVGLGKTIESMYIWEEMIARYNAQRLLIVVPAVLKFKWKNDLKQFFNIDAHIVSAENASNGETLLEHIEGALKNPMGEHFALIISIEGLRISSKVAEVMDKYADVRKVFDLVIIDEAHYLRNSSTASFKTGSRLRDVSESMLLLSATPIQTGSDNFYNLLNLLSPEEFSNQLTFDMQLRENVPLVQLTNALDNNTPKEIVAALVESALQTQVFADDEDILELKNNLDDILADPNKRIKTIDRFKSKFFYNNYITRTRKRDVMKDRVKRNIKTIEFELSDYEKSFYDRVTAYLQKQGFGAEALSVFRLIARQRQMASSMPAALGAWRGQSTADSTVLINEENEEEQGEDFGFDEGVDTKKCMMPTFADVDIEELKNNDSKYNSFAKEIKKLLQNNPKEKIVVFSFFRDTIKYLYERMNHDGINSIFIMGGMRGEEKNGRINDFKTSDINVLISSEVGSEGIDLQFAKYEINYDLPWNPMRIEQRIGRIDRIGQESPNIYIYNAVCQNTIEDRILDRLYARIDVFRNSIGDLEEILGKKIQDLAIDVFNNNKLTEEEIEEKTLQFKNYLAHEQLHNKNLETEAGNLSAYQDFILANINTAQDNKRFVTPGELMFTVKDYLNEKFPGSSVTPSRYEECANINLSTEARERLSDYLKVHFNGAYTRLHYEKSNTLCRFDRKVEISEKVYPYFEDIDINHPLIKWILKMLQTDKLYNSGCSCLSIDKSKLPDEAKLEPGYYTYYIQQWKSSGIRNTNELHYFICNGNSEKPIDNDASEKVLIQTLLNGETFSSNLINDDTFDKALNAFQILDDTAWNEFSVFSEDQRSQNKTLIREQEQYIERTADIKLQKIKETMEGIKNNNNFDAKKKETVLRMHKGRADKVGQDKNDKIRRLNDKLDCSPTFEEISMGILVVSEN